MALVSVIVSDVPEPFTVPVLVCTKQAATVPDKSQPLYSSTITDPPDCVTAP